MKDFKKMNGYAETGHSHEYIAQQPQKVLEILPPVLPDDVYAACDGTPGESAAAYVVTAGEETGLVVVYDDLNPLACCRVFRR